MPTTIIEPLRTEHAELFPQLETLRAAADAVGDRPAPEARRLAGEALAFLIDHLLPHARAEESALYPAVARAMGAPRATATMSRDHVAVQALTNELGTLLASAPDDLDPGQAKALRRLLYGLYTLIGVHFAKEEEVYLPILEESLTPAEAAQMFAAMEAAAHEARHAHAG